MNIENILIEGVGRGEAFGDIMDEEIDISCSDESLLNQRYFFTIYKLPRLIKQILKLRPGCVVILANPFEIEGKEFKPTRDKKKIEKLIKFYAENGFERIKDTQYLAKNMDLK